MSGESTFLVVVVSLAIATLTGLLVWWTVQQYFGHKKAAERFEEEKKLEEEERRDQEPQPSSAAPAEAAHTQVPINEGFEPDAGFSEYADWGSSAAAPPS